ncbi:MAG TPA: MBL fold metallo-hydrolase [Bryobacteraceae bacterium]|nr:MBL fold metallo-hydrolase [Bryobacteraceae bacterium]
MKRLTRRELFQFVSSAAPAFWMASRAAAQNEPTLKLEPLADKLSLLSGAGGNIAVLRFGEGLLLVDSGLPQTAEAMEHQAHTAGPGSIAILINTHCHFDHVGGNERLGRAGARIIAHENLLKRVSTTQHNTFMNRDIAPLDLAGRPKTTFTDGGSLEQGGEKIVYRHLPPAHTDGDATVHFVNENVYHTGDLLFNGMYPFIDYSADGSIEGMVAAADLMIQAVDGKTKIIPGHGPLATRDDLRAFRDMLATVNDRVSKLVTAGQTLDQVVAAEPTKPYDDKFGNGFLKPADFVRMLYSGKTAKRG